MDDKNNIKSDIDDTTEWESDIDYTTEWEAFEQTYHRIIKELAPTTEASNFEQRELYEWIAEVFNWNVPRGKRIRGLATVEAYRTLASLEEQTDENLELARILG